MADTRGFPKWLLDSKENITKSKEWNGFVEELYDAIQQQLRESHVSAFTDLTEAERTLFMERAARAINGGKPYRDLYNKCSVALDQHLNNDVARQLLEDMPINTKSDLIVDAAQDGIVSLLKKWPDMKSKLHIHLNHPLPENLRQLAWRLYMENQKVRKTYVDLLLHNPRAAISPQDLEITKTCERLLSNERTFDELRGSVGVFYAMKAVLSYHHALKKTKDKLPAEDYMLNVPFIQNALPNLSRTQPAASHVVALLVEEYLTFMSTRPGYVVDSGSEFHNQEMKAFVNKVCRHLEEKSPELAKSLSNAYVPSKDQVASSDSSDTALLKDAITSLCRPIIRTMFVGFLRLPVVLYVWDQYMIGSDTPGFHDDYLPAVMAIYLMLLQDKLLKCTDAESCQEVVNQNGTRLKIPQFQYEFNKHFYKSLMASLNQDDKAALPVLDPTQTQAPPWIHWWSDKVQSRVTPQDRRQAREEREAERQRLEAARLEEERRNREEEKRRRQEEEDAFLEQAAKDKRRSEEERRFLEKKLEEERKRRAKAENESAAEIARLQRELDALRAVKSPGAISLDSVISRYLIPPPPTAASRPLTPPQVMSLAPAHTHDPRTQTDDFLLAFLRNSTYAFQNLAHGEGQARKDLDQESKDSIIRHREDVKKAEVEVFGRQLRPGEFNQLSHDEQAQKSDQLMEVIRNRIEMRRQNDIKHGARR